jgi:hexosaminidase
VRVERLPGEHVFSANREEVSTQLNPDITGYHFEVTPTNVTITAADEANAFYARQTLRQMTVSNRIPCVRVEDHPRFKWRGLMLDCSRTFQSVAYLHQTIDRMAIYKLNVLHLHLTDDQGWRLEIKKYPKLTQKGAFFSAKYGEPQSHEGFYTQAQMRELVAYAADHFITIVPEIEMPGHSHEVVVCYPELSCAGKTTNDIFPFYKGPTTTADVYCAGNEDTFHFLQDVLDEVTDIFPSKFIHVGGDEVPKAAWQACPKCQARLKAEGLKNEHELQSYFVRRIEKYLAGKGRRLIGWDEILEGGLAPDATVMSWRGTSGGLAAAKAGHDVVMSPTSHCYFDYSYDDISSASVFAFDPVAGLPPEAAIHILGLQANFWSHIDREPELVDRQLFPRLLAIAERGWSADNRSDWPDYQRRARAQLAQLAQLAIHFQPSDLAAPVGK